MPEAIVALGYGKRVVGRLRFETDGRRQHSQFEYADEWLASRDRFALSPVLPLRQGGHYSTGKDAIRLAIPGCFADAAPDAWGRGLMRKVLGGGLSEFDYLVASDDHSRQGALRFLGEDMEPLCGPGPPVPRRVELSRLRALARRFERNPAGVTEEVRELAGVAGSLGGARPKASIEDDGHLWIAKFTAADDTRPVERAEVAILRLARMCGLRVAEAQLALRDSESPIALVRRFDRRGDERIPYISAHSALDWRRDGGGFYTDVAEVIRQISSRPADDLRELWRRIIFTVLVSNRDDHLKNHGFLYVGNDRWRLSPAFDINPSVSRSRVLETGIIQGGSFEASLGLALEACEFFDIGPADARREAHRMARSVDGNWKRLFRDVGLKGDDIRGYAAAFEHTEIEMALNLDA